MPEKRKSTTSTPRSAEASNKRRKVADNGSPAPPTPSRNGQPDLTEEEKEKLLDWLDNKARTTGVAFPIQYLQARKKAAMKKIKKGQASATVRTTTAKDEEMLSLGGKTYGMVRYVVQNRPKWEQLTRYKKCSVGEETIEQGECVLVNGDHTTEPASSEDPTLPQWKAQVLEVRAINEAHVYVKVAWLYRPAHDLPNGPTNYHGKYELVPSTEISIIDAASLNGSFKIKYWNEYEDDDVPVAEQYYWRQSCDHLAGTLSACRQVCICSQPHNPDCPIIQCKHCQQWMHATCLEERALEEYKEENPMTNGETDEPTHAVDADTDTIDVGTLRPTPAEITSTLEISAEDTEGDGARVIITDHRGPETVTEERDMMCLFEECGRRIDD